MLDFLRMMVKNLEQPDLKLNLPLPMHQYIPDHCDTIVISEISMSCYWSWKTACYYMFASFLLIEQKKYGCPTINLVFKVLHTHQPHAN